MIHFSSRTFIGILTASSSSLTSLCGTSSRPPARGTLDATRHFAHSAEVLLAFNFVAPKRKQILWRPGYQGGSSTINYNFLIFDRSVQKTGISLFKGQELSTVRVRRYKQNLLNLQKTCFYAEQHKSTYTVH